MNPEWADSVFSSAEIEELLYYGKSTMQQFRGQIPLVLFFEEANARDFIASVREGVIDPMNRARLMQLLSYMARVLQMKLDAT